jgi:hypothetical protein
MTSRTQKLPIPIAMDIAPVDEATLDPHESMLAGSIQPRIDLAQRGVADAA